MDWAENATYSLIDCAQQAINNEPDGQKQWLDLFDRESEMGNILSRVDLKIRIIREERGLSQEELGTLAGLHRAYIGEVERGEKNVGLKNVEKIAEALNVSVRVLVDTCAGGE